MTRLHVGSGSVYLDGYTNVDVYSPTTFLAADRPDLVKKWGTTDDQYFAKHQSKTIETLRAGPLKQEYVCDRYGDFSNLPAASWTVEEVLARHVFEHLSITEAHKALDQVDGVLKEGGILRLDVPDSKETLELYRQTGDPFYERALFGPRRDDRGYHLMPYTRELLRSVVEEHGFVFIAEEPNIHFYPAFCLRFVKPGPRAPRDYVELPSIPGDALFLDVGPGQYPHPRANMYLDRDRQNVRRLEGLRKTAMVGDLMEGLSGIPDKRFDYAWCSHVFEHLTDPAFAAKTLSRVAKAGTLVVPSAWKESLTNWEEREHFWQILPHPSCPETAIFIRGNPDRLTPMQDTDAMKILSRVFRTGPNRVTDEQRHLRRWWYEREKHLDVVIHWQNELKLQVIE